MQLTFVPPSDLRKHWDRIKEGLQTLHKRFKTTWIDEDVYSSLKTGSASLYVTDDTFVILYPEKMTDGLALHIWIAYSTNGNAVETYEPQLIEMAKNIGAIRLKLESPRNWACKGYEAVATIFHKEI